MLFAKAYVQAIKRLQVLRIVQHEHTRERVMGRNAVRQDQNVASNSRLCLQRTVPKLHPALGTCNLQPAN